MLYSKSMTNKAPNQKSQEKGTVEAKVKTLFYSFY